MTSGTPHDTMPIPSKYTWVQQVDIIRASQLAIKDSYTSSSDPYCCVQLGNLRARTRTIPRDLNPTWNEKFALDLRGDSNWTLRDLIISVWDEDLGGVSQDFLGEVCQDRYTYSCSLLENQFFYTKTIENSFFLVVVLHIIRSRFQCGF